MIVDKEISYREMGVKDIPSVVEIEKEAFATPWTAEVFEHEMTGNDHAHYVVAVYEEEVIGHCGMWIVLDECHITNVAVREAFKGQWYWRSSDEGSDYILYRKRSPFNDTGSADDQ